MLGSARKTCLVFGMLAACCGAAPALQQPPTLSVEITPKQGVYYVGQMIKATFTLDTYDSDISSENLSVGGLNSPLLGLSQFYPLDPRQETVDGTLVTHNRFATDIEIKGAGDALLSPVVTGMTVHKQSKSAFGMFRQVVSFKATTKFDIPLSIAPLPEPVPEGFCGAVGAFRLSAQVKPEEASPGDILTLAWKLIGYGSLRDFRIPAYDPGDGYRSYPGKETGRDGFNGVSVSQMFVPLSTNVAPPRVFETVIFDPVRGEYMELFSNPFNVSMVEKAREPAAAGDARAPMEWKPSEECAAGGSSASGAGALGGEWRLNGIPARMIVAVVIIFVGLVIAAALLPSTKVWGAVALIATVALAVGAWSLMAKGERESSYRLTMDCEARLCPSAKSLSRGVMRAGSQVKVAEETERYVRLEAAGGGVSGWVVKREGLLSRD